LYFPAHSAGNGAASASGVLDGLSLGVPVSWSGTPGGDQGSQEAAGAQVRWRQGHRWGRSGAGLAGGGAGMQD